MGRSLNAQRLRYNLRRRDQAKPVELIGIRQAAGMRRADRNPWEVGCVLVLEVDTPATRVVSAPAPLRRRRVKSLSSMPGIASHSWVCAAGMVGEYLGAARLAVPDLAAECRGAAVENIWIARWCEGDIRSPTPRWRPSTSDLPISTVTRRRRSKLAPVKKSIYSPIDLREILLGCNRRYIAHLSALDDFSAGIRALGRLSKPREVDGKTVQGINFFAPVDSALLHALQNPRVNIAGIRRSNLLPDLGMISPTRLSRQLRRGCSTSGSSNALPEHTATTSPRPDVPRPQRRNGSPRQLSFRL